MTRKQEAGGRRREAGGRLARRSLGEGGRREAGLPAAASAKAGGSPRDTFCVIMAGGIGSRFWPMSRTGQPKQFLDILGTGETLLQQTWNRYRQFCPDANILVVTNKLYAKLVREQLPQLPPQNILSEPSRRNTAPCIAYASYRISKLNPKANIIVAPSDHLILKEKKFAATLEEALAGAAGNNCLVTLGIRPTRPDTGYGYIQFTDKALKGHPNLRKVKTFTEKPDIEMAKYFMDSGEFLWNSGMFIWNLPGILEALDRHLPDINSVFLEGLDKLHTAGEEAFIRQAYTVCRSVSIDYGVMEKADNVYVVPSDFGWSDLGTWGSLYGHLSRDSAGNAVTGKQVMLYDSSNCLVNLPNDKLAVLQGLDDYIVVESDNILLVCRKADEQKIRDFVNDVKLKKGERFV